MALPVPARCPVCGYVDTTTVCRLCKTDKLRLPAAAPIPKTAASERPSDAQEKDNDANSQH